MQSIVLRLEGLIQGFPVRMMQLAISHRLHEAIVRLMHDVYKAGHMMCLQNEAIHVICQEVGPFLLINIFSGFVFC